MGNETRVNLKHLLEDIRDAYTAPIEEVILVELVANALDSKATRFDVSVGADATGGFLRCVDNGVGMKRASLREYHNIAASTKARGEGIGFAGIGAKLSLLISETVVTESKGGNGSRAATEWRLTGPYRAPWKFVPFTESIPYPRGTAITLRFTNPSHPLLNKEFVRETLIRHFYPLFHDHLREEIVRYVYKKSVQFTIDGELVSIPDEEQRVDHLFHVRAGKGKRPIGAGFLTKNVLAQGWLGRLTGQASLGHHLESGLSVSTYGKVIKGGWEWLGIKPKSASLLCGLVEMPALAELLTTNKSDFLTDAVHLRKFYKIRRAVQEAVIPVLRSLGEYGAEGERPALERNMKPLARELEAALERVSSDFPELAPLLSVRRKADGAVDKKDGVRIGEEGRSKNESAPDAQAGIQEKVEERRVTQNKEKGKKGEKGEGSHKRPGLTLALAELTESPKLLGRVIEETVIINTLHPAWKKALSTKQEEYHIVLVTALSLAEYIDPDKNPQNFLEQLLFSWSEGGTQRKLL